MTQDVVGLTKEEEQEMLEWLNLQDELEIVYPPNFESRADFGRGPIGANVIGKIRFRRRTNGTYQRLTDIIVDGEPKLADEERNEI